VKTVKKGKVHPCTGLQGEKSYEISTLSWPRH